MSEKMRESLSALMDDEANELEIERVLAHIGDDQALRQTWMRYHTARDATDASATQAFMDVDISHRVQAALAQQGSPAVSLRDKFARPLGSFAIAASVATAVVLGGQQLEQATGASQEAGPDLAVVERSQPVVGMPGVSQSFNANYNIPNYNPSSYRVGPVRETLQPATPQAYKNLARMRMGRYMQEHAEHAALNSPQGLVPFARVPRIEE